MAGFSKVSWDALDREAIETMGGKEGWLLLNVAMNESLSSLTSCLNWTVLNTDVSDFAWNAHVINLSDARESSFTLFVFKNTE